MKKYTLYIVLICCCFFGKVKGQVNLVPNGSFELDSLCPNNGSEINYAPPWYSPTWGSPDYFNACAGSALNVMGVPLNYCGYQYAKTGAAYTGIFCYGILSNSPTVEAKEYLQVKLTDSLIQNRKYCISFYVNLATLIGPAYHYLAITEMGLYISNNSFLVTNELTLPYTPQIKSPTGVFLNDTLNWTEVSGTYTAQGGEKYITIGNFNNPTDTLNMPNNNNNITCVSYYYIDDVSVVDCTNAGIANYQLSTLNCQLSPNPTTGIFTIHTEGAAIKEIKITNVLGETITNYELRITNETTVDISGVAKGIYFVQITVDSAGSPTYKNVVNRKIIKY